MADTLDKINYLASICQNRPEGKFDLFKVSFHNVTQSNYRIDVIIVLAEAYYGLQNNYLNFSMLHRVAILNSMVDKCIDKIKDEAAILTQQEMQFHFLQKEIQNYSVSQASDEFSRYFFNIERRISEIQDYYRQNNT